MKHTTGLDLIEIGVCVTAIAVSAWARNAPAVFAGAAYFFALIRLQLLKNG